MGTWNLDDCTCIAIYVAVTGANSGIIFSVVAVTSGLLPLLYEYSNEDTGSGGALSLLVFIIGVQGIPLQTSVVKI